jgi:tetratricopeptide (TPR) repeat protein
MRRLGFIIVCGLMCALLHPGALAPARAAQSLELSVGGNVYYAERQTPAENVAVELRDTSGNLFASQSTTSSGAFEFRGLGRGEFVISIRISGYESIEETEDLNFTSVHGLTFYLKSNSPNTRTSKPGNISAHELAVPQKARDLVDAGKKKMYQAKDAAGALEDFQRAIAAAPDYYEAYGEAGIASVALGKPSDAEASFRKAIELSGDKYPEAEVGLGKVLLEKSDFAEAEKVLRRGAELNPGSWEAHYQLSRALLGENRLDDAERAAQQAKTLSPGTALIYRLLSNIHLRQKNYPALLQDLDAYIKLDPDSPAGVRAKQMRDQVQAKIAETAGGPPSGAKP